jgi:hypothetical protein
MKGEKVWMNTKPYVTIQVLYKYNLNKKFIKMIMSYSWKAGSNIICKSKLTGTKVYLNMGGIS